MIPIPKAPRGSKRWLASVLSCVTMFAAVFASSRVETPLPDLTMYETFRLKEGTPARREAAQKHIEDAVTRELTARGLAASEESPNLYVVTHVLVDRQSAERLSDPDYWEFITGVASVGPYDLGAGTLVFDLVDARTKKIVWRGLANAEVSGSVDKMKKKIDRVVHKAFKDLPSR